MTAERRCAQCGEPLRRREHEAPSKWALRRFCSRPCSTAATAMKLKGRARVPIPPVKPCQGCGQDMRRHPDERVNKWRDRMFCSVSCRYSPPPGSSGGGETKRCEHCGAGFGRGGSSGKRWAARKYCGLKCSRAGQAEAARVEPVVASSAAREVPAAPSKPAVIWRPAGFSRIPNTWAGHRPPPADDAAEVAS